jgi:2'-5' RNA ligase
MDELGGRGVGINSYALVSYLSGPLAAFLDNLRERLAPGCVARAHITVLPPRPINGTAESAWAELARRLQELPPVTVELGDVQVFNESQVIYIAVKTGLTELEDMHRALNHGTVAFGEPFPYHPHITLAQELLSETVLTTLETARRQWEEFSRPRSFVLDRLTFVRNTLDNQWVDLASADLTGQIISR